MHGIRQQCFSCAEPRLFQCKDAASKKEWLAAHDEAKVGTESAKNLSKFWIYGHFLDNQIAGFNVVKFHKQTYYSILMFEDYYTLKLDKIMTQAVLFIGQGSTFSVPKC